MADGPRVTHRGLASQVGTAWAGCLLVLGLVLAACSEAPPIEFRDADAALIPDDRPPSQVVAPTSTTVAAAAPFRSIHAPFARGECGECHNAARGQAIVQPWAQRCGACHADLLNGKTHVHGPVGAFACNQCHVPHASALPALLRQRDGPLCMACHEPSLPLEAPYHDQPALGCVACHDPHGGHDRHLLKPRDQWPALSEQALMQAAASSPTRGGGH